MIGKVAIVAIIRDELPFLDEWLAYHRRIGIDHFFLYINEPDPTNTIRFLEPHRPYTTTIEWYGKSDSLPGRNRQTKAYTHALENYLMCFEWVAFLDVDEFLVFNQHDDVKWFLSGFKDNVSSVSLNWRKFGHNGFFEAPTGLITSSLLRRQALPNRQCKSISKCSNINSIRSAHRCELKQGKRVDIMGNGWSDRPNPEAANIACINHYQCRSFTRWMQRADFGPVAEDVCDQPDQIWSTTKEGCLRQFVKTVAVDFNEYPDVTMLKHAGWLGAEVAKIRDLRTRTQMEKP